MITTTATDTLQPGVLYTTKAAHKAAEERLKDLNRQIDALVAEGNFPVVEYRNLSTKAEELAFALNHMDVKFVEDMTHRKKERVMPGTEVSVLMDGEAKSWIILGPLDQGSDIHPPELYNNIISYLSPIAQEIIGLSHGQTATIPSLPNGKKDIEIKIISVKPWPPQATTKRRKVAPAS